MPKLDELLGHGMEPLVWQDVVVVVVADRLLVQAHGERPEAVGRHFLAQPQGQADQEEPSGEALGVHAAGFPEFSHRAQEFWVGKEHGEVGGGVCQGVVRPQRQVGARLHGEGWHVDVAGAVDLHTVHKSFPRPQKVLKSEGGKEEVILPVVVQRLRLRVSGNHTMYVVESTAELSALSSLF